MINKIKRNVVLIGILLFACSVQAWTEDAKKGTEPMTIPSGKKVFIEYTLTFENKEIMDTNVGREPLTFELGSHQIITGLEKAIEGMKASESCHVTIKPEDAYGPVVKEAIIEVNKDRMPQNSWKVGGQV
jgi:FKBP-type peptidyl-prolyl cis-trans isomerase SlyD